LAAPRSGLGPVVNKSRRRQSFDDNGRPFAGAANAPLVSNNTRLVGDYTNPVLKPQAAQAGKEHGEIELGGWPPPADFRRNSSGFWAHTNSGHSPEAGR
jgi:hypothetical protein